MDGQCGIETAIEERAVGLGGWGASARCSRIREGGLGLLGRVLLVLLYHTVHAIMHIHSSARWWNGDRHRHRPSTIDHRPSSFQTCADRQ
jgi:hypothetical protein